MLCYRKLWRGFENALVLCYLKTLQGCSFIIYCLSPPFHCLDFSNQVKSINKGAVLRARTDQA